MKLISLSLFLLSFLTRRVINTVIRQIIDKIRVIITDNKIEVLQLGTTNSLQSETK